MLLYRILIVVLARFLVPSREKARAVIESGKLPGAHPRPHVGWSGRRRAMHDLRPAGASDRDGVRDPVPTQR